MESSYQICDYPACDHIKRTKPNKYIDKDILEKFLSDCDVLPLAEKKEYDYMHLRHSSLVSNNQLRCRWAHYKEKSFGKKRIPLKFPTVNDDHFYLYQCRFAPTQSQRVLMRGAKRAGYQPLTK